MNALLDNTLEFRVRATKHKFDLRSRDKRGSWPRCVSQIDQKWEVYLHINVRQAIIASQVLFLISLHIVSITVRV